MEESRRPSQDSEPLILAHTPAKGVGSRSGGFGKVTGSSNVPGLQCPSWNDGGLNALTPQREETEAESNSMAATSAQSPLCSRPQLSENTSVCFIFSVRRGPFMAGTGWFLG